MNPVEQSSWEIDFRNDQQCLAVDPEVLRHALVTALQAERVASAVLSISLVDNSTIHRLNREHLQHDYPTDVISFQLDFAADSETDHSDNDVLHGNGLRATGAAIEGEIIASAQMAAEMAGDGGWSPQAELTLYLVHGLLHICGYDDLTPQEQSIMRDREREILSRLGLTLVYAEDSSSRRQPGEFPDNGMSGASA